MEIIEFELIEKYARNYTETPIKLIPGALYKSGNYTNHKAEQLSKLLGVGNSSGFRSKNVIKQKKTAYIVATITHENNDWNDTIDFSTSEVIYYGDNAKSNDILLTKQNGNKKLKYLFENSDDPSVQFPLFLFYRDTDCRNRDFKYAGIMVPNYNDNGLEIVENDNGIKNYKAHLTLTQDIIDLKWIADLQNGVLPIESKYCPLKWRELVLKNNVSTMTVNTAIQEEIKFEQEFDPTADSKEIEKYIERKLKVRKGQGAYRNKLIKYKKCKCELCSINKKELLFASHIKPWKDCDNKEAYDKNNGLLLCANHDVLFDKGLITFDKNGKIQISSLIEESTYSDYNINKNMHIVMNKAELGYMKHHNKHVFIK